MNKSGPQDKPRQERKPAQPRTLQEGADLQPPPTGANRGSPAAPVMKQSAKTKAEGTGRS